MDSTSKNPVATKEYQELGDIGSQWLVRKADASEQASLKSANASIVNDSGFILFNKNSGQRLSFGHTVTTQHIEPKNPNQAEPDMLIQGGVFGMEAPSKRRESSHSVDFDAFKAIAPDAEFIPTFPTEEHQLENHILINKAGEFKPQSLADVISRNQYHNSRLMDSTHGKAPDTLEKMKAVHGFNAAMDKHIEHLRGRIESAQPQTDEEENQLALDRAALLVAVINPQAHTVNRNKILSPVDSANSINSRIGQQFGGGSLTELNDLEGNFMVGKTPESTMSNLADDGEVLLAAINLKKKNAIDTTTVYMVKREDNTVWHRATAINNETGEVSAVNQAAFDAIGINPDHFDQGGMWPQSNPRFEGDDIWAANKATEQQHKVMSAISADNLRRKVSSTQAKNYALPATHRDSLLSDMPHDDDIVPVAIKRSIEMQPITHNQMQDIALALGYVDNKNPHIKGDVADLFGVVVMTDHHVGYAHEPKDVQTHIITQIMNTDGYTGVKSQYIDVLSIADNGVSQNAVSSGARTNHPLIVQENYITNERPYNAKHDSPVITPRSVQNAIIVTPGPTNDGDTRSTHGFRFPDDHPALHSKFGNDSVSNALDSTATNSQILKNEVDPLSSAPQENSRKNKM